MLLFHVTEAETQCLTMGELVLEREQVLQDMFCSYDVTMKGGLNAKQLQLLHSELRIGGISLPQVRIAI